MELEQTFILQVVERSGDIESAVVHFLRYPLHLDTDNLLASESKTMELEEAYDALLQRLRGDTEQAAVQFLRLRRDEVDEVDAEDLEESGELEYLLLFEAHDATVGLGDVGVGEPLVESEDGLCLEYIWRTNLALPAASCKSLRLMPRKRGRERRISYKLLSAMSRSKKYFTDWLYCARIFFIEGEYQTWLLPFASE